MEDKIIEMLAESGMSVKEASDFLREIATMIMGPAYETLDMAMSQPLAKRS